jgi:hypothetical protein
MNTEFWCTNLKKNDHLEDTGTDGITRILNKQDGIASTGLIWLWIDTTERPL